MYYLVFLAVFVTAYLGHYLAHGYDLVEALSLGVGVVVLSFLAIKDRRANK